MLCPKCNAENIEGSSFCIKCGTNLKEFTNTPINPAPAMNEPNLNLNQQQNQNLNQPMNFNNMAQNQTSYANQSAPVYGNSVSNNNFNTKPSGEKVNLISYLMAFFLKPVETFKEEKEKLSSASNAFLLTLVMAIFLTLGSLIQTVITLVHVCSYGWFTDNKCIWKWENLKYIRWFDVIGKNLLIYFCVLLVIGAVFYVGSLIVKKELSFQKALTTVSSSVLPLVLGFALAPILKLIWTPLNFIVPGVCGIYSFLLLNELMGSNLNLEGEKKIHFILACFAALILIAYIVYAKVLGSILNF